MYCTHGIALWVSLFVSHYWFHSVLGYSTCKYLRWCSLWQYYCQRCIMYIEQWCCTLFLHINFLLFVLVWCWVHFVTGNSTLVQVVPGNSSLFELVSPCSRWFQLVPGSSSSCQVVKGGSSSFLILVYTLLFTCFFID